LIESIETPFDPFGSSTRNREAATVEGSVVDITVTAWGSLVTSETHGVRVNGEPLLPTRTQTALSSER